MLPFYNPSKLMVLEILFENKVSRSGHDKVKIQRIKK